MAASSARFLTLASLVLVLVAMAFGFYEATHLDPTRTEEPERVSEPVPRARPRNVILISLDTLRADHLGAWGYARDTSPKLDAFAEDSVIFRRAVAQGSSTIPSHAALFTSQYASAVTVPRMGLMEAPTTLAEALSDAGFATWGFVDGGNVRKRFGFGQGFDEYQDRRVGVRTLLRRARRWLKTHPQRPFFLFLHTYEIHTPYKSPRAYVELFGDPEYQGRFVPNTHYFRQVERQGKGLSPSELHEVVARYDAGIRLTDDALGSFFNWLRQRGLLADSLVVIVSDHGEEFLEHGRLGHQQLHLDPNLRVPLLFHGPGLQPSVFDQTVELNDVAPTILGVLGLAPLPGAQGKSLAPLLYGEESASPGLAYSEKGIMPGQQTLISDRYQLLEDRSLGQQWLFDLEAGARARVDLSQRRPGVAKMMATELDRRRSAAILRHAQHRRQVAPEVPVEPLRDEIRRELEVLGYLEP